MWCGRFYWPWAFFFFLCGILAPRPRRMGCANSINRHTHKKKRVAGYFSLFSSYAVASAFLFVLYINAVPRANVLLLDHVFPCVYSVSQGLSRIVTCYLARNARVKKIIHRGGCVKKKKKESKRAASKMRRARDKPFCPRVQRDLIAQRCAFVQMVRVPLGVSLAGTSQNGEARRG